MRTSFSRRHEKHFWFFVIFWTGSLPIRIVLRRRKWAADSIAHLHFRVLLLDCGILRILPLTLISWVNFGASFMILDVPLRKVFLTSVWEWWWWRLSSVTFKSYNLFGREKKDKDGMACVVKHFRQEREKISLTIFGSLHHNREGHSLAKRSETKMEIVGSEIPGWKKSGSPKPGNRPRSRFSPVPM